MKRMMTLALLVALSVAALMAPAAVFAADTGTVTCTVTATLVSISVDNGNVDFGALDLGATKNTALYDETNNPDGMVTPQTQNITNTGNVNVDLWISSSDAIGAAANWTLSVTNIDEDEFVHYWYDSATPYVGGEMDYFTCFGSLAGVSFGMASGANVTPGDSRYVELRIDMPSETTDYGAHTITVTVEARQS